MDDDIQEASPDMNLVKDVPGVAEVGFKALNSELSHVINEGIDEAKGHEGFECEFVVLDVIDIAGEHVNAEHNKIDEMADKTDHVDVP